MAEPLSITVGVVSILKVCVSVGVELKTFCNDVKNVNEAMTSLAHEVSSLEQMLETMKDTFDRAEDRSFTQQTGHIGGHWQNILRALEDGDKSLGKLGSLLQTVNKETKLLNGTRKKIRMESAAAQIATFQGQIQNSRQVLGLSMQAILL
jgi:hypothetical protein